MTTKYARANHESETLADPITTEELNALPKENADTLFVIVPPMAEDKDKVMAMMEYTYYPPDTPFNKEFELFLYHWPQRNPYPFAVYAIPMKDKQLLEKVAKAMGFGLSRDHGPAVYWEGAVQHFPWMKERYPNVFFLIPSKLLEDKQHLATLRLGSEKGLLMEEEIKKKA